MNPEFEIGDGVVFTKIRDAYGCIIDNPRWKAGTIVDVAEDVIEVEFRTWWIRRRKWIRPGYKWSVCRKIRAEEIISRYEKAGTN